MSVEIHPTAIIDPSAKIGDGTKIGPYAVLNSNVVVGENCDIKAHAYIDRFTTLGNGVKIFPSAVLGTQPQDLKFGGEETRLEIGDNSVIREFAMLSRGTKHSWVTRVGKNCLIMAYVHLGHDVQLGDNVILANGVQLAGHVIIEDFAGLGGHVVVHQFCRIGTQSFIEGLCKIKKDVPPFILAMSIPLVYGGPNAIGLKRRGFTDQQIKNIKNAYRLYFKSGLNATQAIARMKDDMEQTDEVKKIISFIENTERGTIR